jgi:hypothetical protein
MNESHESLQVVRLVWEYWDEPRSGVADYNSMPHWFECLFDEDRDEYSHVYWLTPLDDSLFELLKERNSIFLRWRDAFGRGEVDRSTHPALPSEAERSRELESEIRQGIASRANQRFKVRGRFQLLTGATFSGELSDFGVEWALIAQ